MSFRAIGYVGEGRERRAIVVDHGPSSVRRDPSKVGGSLVVGSPVKSETAAYLRERSRMLRARAKAAAG